MAPARRRRASPSRRPSRSPSPSRRRSRHPSRRPSRRRAGPGAGAAAARRAARRRSRRRSRSRRQPKRQSRRHQPPPVPVTRTASIDQKRAQFREAQAAAAAQQQEDEQAEPADEIANIINNEDSRGAVDRRGRRADAGQDHRHVGDAEPVGDGRRWSRRSSACMSVPPGALEAGVTATLEFSHRCAAATSGPAGRSSLRADSTIGSAFARAARRAVHAMRPLSDGRRTRRPGAVRPARIPLSRA